MNNMIKVKCPTCKKKFEYSLSKFRPFCTERCKMIDLGEWLNESYSMASNEALNEEDIEKVIEEISNQENKN